MIQIFDAVRCRIDAGAPRRRDARVCRVAVTKSGAGIYLQRPGRWPVLLFNPLFFYEKNILVQILDNILNY